MRVAFIHAGALGDLVIALPTLQTLRAEEAERIDLFASAGRHRLLAGRTVVTDGHSLESAPFACLFGEPFDPAHAPPELARCLAGFEDVISAYPSSRFASSLARLTGARVRTLEVRASQIDSSGVHAAEFLHRQLFGALVSVPHPEITLTDADKARAADLLGAGPGQPTVLIHPGSGSRAKCWPVDGFRAVADALSQAGLRVVVILGDVETERMSPLERQTLTNGYKALSDLALEQLAGVIGAADAFVGNDSGPSHLAAALGKPTVAIFGPTNPEVWGPRGPRVRVLRGELWAGPGWGVRPADVCQAVQTQLAG